MTAVSSSGLSWQMHLPPGKLGKAGGGEPYEHALLLDMASEQLCGSAFDVGAYYGNHSVFLALVCGLSVHAFEADPARVHWLNRNVELNGVDVTVHPWAVGMPGTAHWAPSKSRKLEPGSGPVGVFAIDDWLDVPDLAVVKLDIEGMEAQALAGMRRHLTRRRPLVYSETHDVGADQAAVLEAFGYVHERTIQAPSPMRKWRWRG